MVDKEEYEKQIISQPIPASKIIKLEADRTLYVKLSRCCKREAVCNENVKYKQG